MSPGHICSQYEASEACCATASTRRSVRFLVALYSHALMVVILVIFSRNVFSTVIRTTLLPLLR
jgi:hypothetical protein